MDKISRGQLTAEALIQQINIMTDPDDYQSGQRGPGQSGGL